MTLILRIRIFRFCVLILNVFFLVGCSTVSLAPKDFSPREEDLQQGRVILLSSIQKRDPDNRWAQFKWMKVIARDLWQSQSLRSSTPIPQANQQIQFAFNLVNDDAVAKLLTGSQSGNIFGVARGETYLVKKGIRVQKTSQKIKWYLSPVRNYFLWPQTILCYKNIVYLGQEKQGRLSYFLVFVSNGDSFEQADEDQYIVWVNSKTFYIDFIEFALRDPAKSYRGVVQYGNYKNVHGVILPHEIIILDKMEKNSFSHKFYVEIFSLE